MQPIIYEPWFWLSVYWEIACAASMVYCTRVMNEKGRSVAAGAMLAFVLGPFAQIIVSGKKDAHWTCVCGKINVSKVCLCGEEKPSEEAEKIKKLVKEINSKKRRKIKQKGV